jgi:hypothetical protein
MLKADAGHLRSQSKSVERQDWDPGIPSYSVEGLYTLHFPADGDLTSDFSLRSREPVGK